MKRFKCLVKECGHVIKTKSGMTSHVKIHHNETMVKGVTYTTTSNPVSNPNRNGPHKAKKCKAKPATVPVITAETQYVDVPCVLRVVLAGFEVKDAFILRG